MRPTWSKIKHRMDSRLSTGNHLFRGTQTESEKSCIVKVVVDILNYLGAKGFVIVPNNSITLRAAATLHWTEITWFLVS